MSRLMFTFVESEQEKWITVYYDGEAKSASTSTHGNFDEIVSKAKAGDVSVIYDFEIGAKIVDRFAKLSERVVIQGDDIIMDGKPLNSALTDQILRFYHEDVEDWKPLVHFLEKVSANPSYHSRNQLYAFLQANDFSISPTGDIVGYKGLSVTKDDEGEITGRFSGHVGTAFVNGILHSEVQIPQDIGDIVTMPRDEVDDNFNAACSAGLHVSTYGYAKTYGAVHEVHVNPADVVSVPSDSAEKIRCCRYVVVGAVDEPHTEVLVEDTAPENDWTSPTQDEFDTMIARAHRRRRNFVKYARKHGPWVYLGDATADPKDDRLNWSIVSKEA